MTMHVIPVYVEMKCGKLNFSYGNLVTYMNDGTSLKSVGQIRRTDNLQSIIWVTLEHS